ncbi:MAG: anhydro-N-acetylmuramic acid kinase [Rhodanobacter sp.]
MADTPELYIGLISGTSLDGIDAVLVAFDADQPQLRASYTHPWEAKVRARLLTLTQDGMPVDLDAFGRLDHAVGTCFADAALQLLHRCEADPRTIRAIGSHGQTIRHRPTGPDRFTLQIGDPTIIAERCGIDVVADFRRGDMAAGGQGAPLVPLLHATMLHDRGQTRVVLNLGGIANVTVLHADGQVHGFDTGPANGLLDAWCLRQRGEHFDKDGAFAASGEVDQDLLEALLADPYFAQAPPKSTGREYFHLGWLANFGDTTRLRPADVQATLLELTARSVAAAITEHAADAAEVLVCGGGVHNVELQRRLHELLAPRIVASTAAYGMDPDFVEATAFAWLARQRVLGRTGNLPAVTGAKGTRILGALYCAPGAAAA